MKSSSASRVFRDDESAGSSARVSPGFESAWTLPTWLEAMSFRLASLVSKLPRLARLLRWLLGRRFVDLPIRVLVGYSGVVSLFPVALESDEPLYVLLHYVSGAVVIASAFVPRSAGLLAVGLFLVFAVAYPQLLNPFDTPVSIAAAVLLSEGRWRWWISLLILTAGSYWALISMEPGQMHLLRWGTYFWVQNGLLALAAFALEARILREVALRKEAAEKSAEEILRSRLSVAVDMHDTISHGLATQTAIIRLLALEKDREAATRMLGELALVTDRSQAELRRLLDGLRDSNTGDDSTPVGSEELLRELDGMRAAAAVSGLEVTTNIGELPRSFPARDAEQVRFVMRELVTNLVKHSSPAWVECGIGIRSVTADNRSWLVIDSRNPVENAVPGVPWSLSVRADGLGGNCSAECVDREYRVTVRLPISGGQLVEKYPSNEGCHQAELTCSMDE